MSLKNLPCTCTVMALTGSTIPIKSLNVKRTVDGIRILRRHFEWQGRPRSMELKYGEALCELAASTRHAGKLIRFGER